jgi:FkbM family methyltransferase
MKTLLQWVAATLGTHFPWLVKLILILLYPFPSLFVSLAHWSGIRTPVSRRKWRIYTGPLKGYQITALHPMEISPILHNTMEVASSNLLSKLDLESSVVFDVGASYGYYALLFSRLVGSGRIFSFEPDWRSYGRLTQNLVINEIQNVIAVAVCIANSEPALKHWHHEQDMPWKSKLAHDPQAYPEELAMVPVVSLDEFSRQAEVLDKVRLIKIDVEGDEADALAGASLLLASSRPLIICELHSTKTAHMVFQFLSSKNYEWSFIEYINEERQHILAYPACHSGKYRALIGP